MASSLCLSCLRHSLAQIEGQVVTNGSQRAAFSTSSSLFAASVKKKAVVAKPAARTGRTLRLSKNKRAVNARPPAPGERKALRKRVVLSNTNALEVAGLQDLSAKVADSASLHRAYGRVLGLTDATVDTLRALEVFKPTQSWSLFRRPASLITKSMASVAESLESIAEGSSNGRTIREVLFGERGSGKSVLQLQALALASLKGWIVVHIPEAKDLTNAHTSYEPVSTPDGTLYIQPHYTAKLLDNIVKANHARLSKLRISKQHNLPITLAPDTTLARLAELGARDPDLAYPIYEALWTELLAPSQADKDGLARPPVLFSLDGLDHVMRVSSYLNAETEPIHAHELALIRRFMDMLSGRTSLPNGGMVFGAVSESNRASSRTLDHFLKANHASQTGTTAPKWNPYEAQDKWVQEVMQDVSVRKLEGLSKEEARGIMEYYARSGMLRHTVTDNLVSEKWTMAGGGIIGQLEQASVRARF